MLKHFEDCQAWHNGKRRLEKLQKLRLRSTTTFGTPVMRGDSQTLQWPLVLTGESQVLVAAEVTRLKYCHRRQQAKSSMSLVTSAATQILFCYNSVNFCELA
jgi:hypothetical protein